MLEWARQHAPGRRVWALEGTGSFAAGLAGELALAGEDVVEVGALKRARGSKNDRLDAVRAARTALAREHQPSPCVGGLREGIRALSATRQAGLVSRTKAINELRSLIVVAPEQLRALLRPSAGNPADIDRKHGHHRGRHGRTPDHAGDHAVDHRAHTVSWQPARGHRTRAGPSDPRTPCRAGTARRTSSRTGRRGPTVDHLVPPRTGQLSLRHTSPWQHSNNENISRLQRHCFDKCIDFSVDAALAPHTGIEGACAISTQGCKAKTLGERHGGALPVSTNPRWGQTLPKYRDSSQSVIALLNCSTSKRRVAP